jgi:uncharacterized protein YndB with AHSA1/START domain
MTEHKSFKRLVRARMAKTRESYTAARAQLLTGRAQDGAGPPLPMSDAAIRERTGRGWEEWFDVLDEWGAADRPHREIARWLAGRLDGASPGWNAQAITVGYERARGGRAVGQRDDGFAVSVTRTVAGPVELVFDAFVDERARRRWLPEAELRPRTATRPKSARFDWGGDQSRVHVSFTAKEGGRSAVALSHERLADAAAAARMKAYWRERLEALKAQLER